MSTAEIKYDLFKIIDTINDSKALKEIKKFVANKLTTDWWDELSPEQKSQIEKGLKDVKAGRVHTHEEVIKRVKSKFNFK